MPLGSGRCPPTMATSHDGLILLTDCKPDHFAGDFCFFFLVAHFTFCHQLHIIAFTIFYSIIIACKTWKACSQQWYCFHIFHNIVSMFTTRNIFVETGKALKASWIKHSTLSLTGEGHGGKQLVSRETRMPIPNVWVIQ